MNRIVIGRQAHILALAVAVFCTMAGPSEAFYLPDSDQRKCFQAVLPYLQVPCVGSGQDGAYVVNALSYTDNRDGTVTDNNTGLTWQKRDDGLFHNWYAATGTYHAAGNPLSIDVCGSLVLGGHNDWRLPTTSELMTIADYAAPQGQPTIRKQYFPGTKLYSYWSSPSFAGDPGRAWTLDFGLAYSSTSYVDKLLGGYVRCVRGAQTPGPGLVANANGTVTDTRTGLIWEQGEPGPMTWGAALSYCETLSLGQSSSWRLPNIKELGSLTDHTRQNPAIDATKFPGVHWAVEDIYLSSSILVNSQGGSSSQAWYVYPKYGVVGYSGAYTENTEYYFRCVRGGSNALSDALDAARPWKTGGPAPWHFQITETHDGADAAQSGQVADAKSSWLQTSVVGPKTVSFWWKTSSEAGDQLQFFIDATLMGSRSGINGWAPRSFQIPSGGHVVKWSFARDASGSAGMNAGFVDRVRIMAPAP